VGRHVWIILCYNDWSNIRSIIVKQKSGFPDLVVRAVFADYAGIGHEVLNVRRGYGAGTKRILTGYRSGAGANLIMLRIGIVSVECLIDPLKVIPRLSG
jgi:hypothetical protein